MHLNIASFSPARLTAGFLAAVLTVILTTLGLMTSAQAQQTTSALDLEPPRIAFEPSDRGLAGEVQVFSATVSDDIQLDAVYLYHRLLGDVSYSVVQMDQLDDTSIFSAKIATSADDARDIEYYLLAEDVSGNKTLRGFAFDPLVKDITADMVATSATLGTGVGMSRNRKILWTVLGIAAVGLIASQVGDSGGSSEPASTPIGITVNPVEN